MKNFFEPVSLKAQSHRNPFDLSYQFQNTIPFGAILPCGFWPVNPNDKIRLTNEYQLICDALARPAFARMKAHVNYYFVPATQIQMSFDNFITGQDSYFSSSVKDINADNPVPIVLPTFNGAFLSSMFSTMVGKKDELGYPIEAGAVRLLDALGYCNLNAFLLDISSGGSSKLDDPSSFVDFDRLPEMNFNALACYQKVYYDYFRNPKYEDNDTEAYNLDNIAPGIQIYNKERFDKLFKLHYRWAKKDYFMNVQPNVLVDSSQLGYSGLNNNIQQNSQIFGIPGLNYQTANSSLKAPYQSSSSALSSTPQNQGDLVQAGIYSSTNTLSVISVANIRTAFAFDRLLRRMREAGADFDKQMLSQYGVAPYDARHGKCYHIGGFVNQLTVNSITNMTNDVQSPDQTLGELAGQINFYADNSAKTLDYHVREMGYIIGVISISNDNSYQSYRINRYNVFKDRFDFYNPVFEDLGLQPLFKFEMDYTDETTVDDPTNPNYSVYGRGQSVSINPKQILGYIRRYQEYKTRADEIHGILCKWSGQQEMTAWNMQYYRSPAKSQQFGVGALTIADMLQDPALLDSVAVVNYNGLPTTDHFILNMYNHYHVVSNMSRLGENF